MLVPFGCVLVQFSRIDTHPAFDAYENIKLGVNDHTILVGGQIGFRVYWQCLKFYMESYEMHAPGCEFDHLTGWSMLNEGDVPSNI